MKKIWMLVLILFVLSSAAIADITLYGNGNQKGRVENVNIKGGAAASKSGQLGTIDFTAGAFSNSGINWLDIQQAQMNQAGVNWQALNIVSGGINWNVLQGQAIQGQLMCWNTTNGKPGKCTAAVSGTGCTCN